MEVDKLLEWKGDVEWRGNLKDCLYHEDGGHKWDPLKSKMGHLEKYFVYDIPKIQSIWRRSQVINNLRCYREF